jgi:hypothetical protein
MKLRLLKGIDRQEIEFEGDVNELKNPEVQNLIRGSIVVPSFSRSVGRAPLDLSQPTESGRGTRDRSRRAVDRMTTSTIMARLGTKADGKNLALAALAKLGLSDEKETFSREEILLEMKSATAYYRENYRKTLTSYLARLSTDRVINECSPNVYALIPAAMDQLFEKLAASSGYAGDAFAAVEKQ